MRCKIFIWLVVGIFLINSVFAISDISVFQGQYHNETSFIQGTFEFTFDVYDAGVGGNLLGSHKKNLTTGSWGQWKAEIPGISSACNDSSKDYFIEILIDGVLQLPRRRLSHFKYLRKDTDDSTLADLNVGGVLRGEFPLKVGEALSFVDLFDEEEFSVYIGRDIDNHSTVPEAFEDSLIFQATKLNNPNKMEICFWDDEDKIMFFCIGEGGQNRATTVRRSFQIVGNTSVKENDEDFTLCENANYVDCSTSTTGADLLVQDDIEAQSIYANENVTASSGLFTWLGSLVNKITKLFVTDIDVENDLDVGGNVNIVGNVNITGTVSFGGNSVCLEDGTNCPASSDSNCSINGSCSNIVYESELNYTIYTDTSASTECSADEVLLGNGSCQSSSGFGGGGSGGISGAPVSFVSTVDGKLNKNDRYLALGTDGGISGSVTEMAWIIDRGMTITGIFWDSKSNSRTKTSAITLKGGSSKNSLSDTSLSKDIQGVVNGSDLTFSVSLSQGDVVAIKYDSGGNGGDIEDLSITLIGTYD